MIFNFSFKRLLSVVSAGAFAATMTVSPAQAQIAGSLGLAETCAFAATIPAGSEAIGEKFYELASGFNEGERKGLSVQLQQQLEPFGLHSPDIYEVVRLGEVHAEYLIVAPAKQDRRPVFFRLKFSSVGGQPALMNFLYNTSFEKITEAQFTKNPELVICG